MKAQRGLKILPARFRRDEWGYDFQDLHQLKYTGPDEILAEIRDWQKKFPERQEITSNLAYLEKRKQHMRYPLFQEQGWPIGSGIVESGKKVVVESRTKGAGMHWAENNVNPMLAIRNILCSDRWKDEWPKIELKLRQQTALFRRRRQQERAYFKHLENWQPLNLPMPVIQKKVPAQSKPNP